MPRVRFTRGDTVQWELAGEMFSGVVRKFLPGRHEGYRSCLVNFDPAHYERRMEANERWSQWQRHRGWPAEPIGGIPPCWVEDNLVDEEGCFVLSLHTDFVTPMAPGERLRDGVVIPPDAEGIAEQIEQNRRNFDRFCAMVAESEKQKQAEAAESERSDA